MHSLHVRASDSVAVAVEEHLRSMESAGFGELTAETIPEGIRISFGPARVRGENYDIALVRLPGAILNDANLGTDFLARLRAKCE